MAFPTPSWSDPHQPAGLTALTYSAGDATVIAVSGTLDMASAVALDGPLTVALDAGHRHLVLDLHLLQSINTESLSVLWAALRRAKRCGGTLAAAGASPSLLPELEPLVPHGLRLYGAVRSAISASRATGATPPGPTTPRLRPSRDRGRAADAAARRQIPPPAGRGRHPGAAGRSHGPEVAGEQEGGLR